jgi:hypothetical protein
MKNKILLRNNKELRSNRVMNSRKMLNNNILVQRRKVHKNSKNSKYIQTNFGYKKGVQNLSHGVMMSLIIVHSKGSSLAHFPTIK